MPIRLNLLAEAQALEEQRRRDPVKRALWIAALLVVLMLAWAGSLQFKAFFARQALNSTAASMAAITNDYRKVIEGQKRIADDNRRLAALHTLATNRFLYGNLLDALQHSVLDDVQLTALKVEQAYAIVAATKPKTNANNTVSPAKPPTSTERIVITLDGVDSSASPGDQVTAYKALLNTNAYFHSLLGRTNQFTLKSLSTPQVDPLSGRAVVLFSLEAALPPKTR